MLLKDFEDFMANIENDTDQRHNMVEDELKDLRALNKKKKLWPDLWIDAVADLLQQDPKKRPSFEETL